MSSEPIDVTALLEANRQGSHKAKDELVARLYDEFRRRARVRIRTHERPDLSLEATDLADMTLERLLRSQEIERADNAHELFRAFARSMKQVLIDHIRRKEADKRGGGWDRVPLDDLADAVVQTSPVGARSLENLHEALELLAEEYPTQAEHVEMRYFGGYSPAEIAQIQKSSLTDVKKNLRLAEACLRDFLSRGSNP